MIAAYRLVPLTSNNVRTLFCSTAKLTDKRKRWPSHDLLNNVRTGTSNNYQLLDVREGVRVLFVNNPNFKDKRYMYCGIRIGAGSEDDPYRIQGRAHLLEHILCKADWSEGLFAQTYDHYTIYSFKLLLKGNAALEKLGKWARNLFSDKYNLQSIRGTAFEYITKERDVIDNEFQQIRCGSHVRKVIEIVKAYGLHVAKFGYGNKNTLSDIDDRMNDAQKNMRLLKELDAFRDIYRERPVNICICTAEEQNMEEILKVLNVNYFLEHGTVKEAVQHWPRRDESQIDFSQHLIVSQSYDETTQFHIIFPIEIEQQQVPRNTKNVKLKRTLDGEESSTMNFICGMISLDTEGCLKRWLFEKKWAVNCTAFFNLNAVSITVYLTTGPTGGLKNIDKVKEGVQNYLTFLHDKWDKLTEFEYRMRWNKKSCDELIAKPASEYVHYVASHLTGKKETFGENDLFEGSNDATEPTLIKKQILDNEKTIFAISSQNRNSVFDDLNHVLKDDQPMVTERIYGATYSIHNVDDLFKKESSSGHNEFELKDLSTIHPQANNLLKISVYIHEPKDVAFQLLCYTHTYLNFARYWTIDGIGEFENSYDHIKYKHPDRAFPHNELVNDRNYLNMDYHSFEMCKSHLMMNLSEKLTDSLKLARSLMKTAVANVHNTIKIDSLPRQYKTVKDMTHHQYLGRVFVIQVPPSTTNALTNKDTYNDSLRVMSLNGNEMITVTLLFCQTDNDPNAEVIHEIVTALLRDMDQEKNLYCSNCEIDKFAEKWGLLIKIHSVENKTGQRKDDIVKLIKNIMTQKLHSELSIKIKHCGQDQALALPLLYQKLLGRMLLVQVCGHDHSFGYSFDNWYEANHNKFAI